MNRREFVACLMAALARSSLPAITHRKVGYIIRMNPIAVGAEICGFAEGRAGPRGIYDVPVIVRGVRKVVDDCYVWAVDYNPDVFGHVASIARHVPVIPVEIPDQIVDLTMQRIRNDDLWWLRKSRDDE